MTFLTGIQIRRKLNDKSILIYSIDPRYPFDPDQQVTEDSIDLRLAPMGLKFRSGLRKIDYLNDDLDTMFETIDIPPDTGYTIKGGGILFTQTLEAMSLPDDMIGLVVTRSTFARLGIMVTCGAPKFAAGISWAFPLQIVNCGSIPIVIYPYTVIAQVLLGSLQGPPVGYQGRYQNTYTPIPPVINDRERKFLQTMTSDSAKRTFHILAKEIEMQKEEITRQVQEHKSETIERRDQDRLHEKKRSLRVRLIRLILTVLGGLSFGIAGNIISDSTLEHWQFVSLTLLILLGALLAVSPLFIFRDDEENTSTIV